MNGKTLFDNFREISAKEWKQKIQYALKGKEYNEEVVWDTPEGIKIKPFYNSEDLGNTTPLSATGDSWKIGHLVYAGNARMANANALRHIERGAEAITFLIPNDTIDVSSLLDNIDINLVKIYFDMQFLSKSYISNSIHRCPDASKISFAIDPVGYLARTGNWHHSMKEDLLAVKDILSLNIENVLQVNVGLYENAGADIVQQLAYAMAHANEYLHMCQEQSDLRQLKKMEFKLAIGGNYFFEISKIRALRKLWSTLIGAYEISIPCHIISTPSRRNKTVYDYNVNMLRTTTESMAAVLGGSDTVFNMPYDAIFKKENKFSNRIALNQLLLLKEESYFAKVKNPADGSYYIETLTDQLAEKALLYFKRIEKEGGFLKLLKSHTIQQQIATAAKKQQEKFNSKQMVLVGTNAFVTNTDTMSNEIELFPFVKRKPRKTLILPIIEKRLAEELEQNRLSHE
ncbi:methylmalonyl-CoA mutase [Maribacter sedimenticola]|uniref:Methylmalonyl-CoA mutase n=1 Tax=Maribacter sedimenticola TaxID=228956 RepID=A0ABY1SCK6_9FLAO|nr:methylmalonyl-CoA mutase subunit beta [Maribacter sedimenticola]SNR26478.1 methylmalonyl-CoA mutase [Maribacter sedimenticola]